LLNRLHMIDRQDGIIALKHVYAGVHPGQPFDRGRYRTLRRNSRSLIRMNFPHRMCAQMLLKPLGLGPRTRRIVLPLTMALSRWVATQSAAVLAQVPTHRHSGRRAQRPLRRRLGPAACLPAGVHLSS
jgi:hypothetical protein